MLHAVQAYSSSEQDGVGVLRPINCNSGPHTYLVGNFLNRPRDLYKLSRIALGTYISHKVHIKKSML